MRLRTRVTELLGIEHPVIQGAMARIADGRLAAAVSEAGGLGIIACGGAPLDWVEEQVRRARSLTAKPLGANVMLMDPHAADVAALLAELRVDVITTGAGSPSDYLGMWKDAGIKVVPVVASCAQARRMERTGVDAVVAEGTESGGHVGELTTMALVPAVSRRCPSPSSRQEASPMAAAWRPRSCSVPKASRWARGSSLWRSAQSTMLTRRRC